MGDHDDYVRRNVCSDHSTFCDQNVVQFFDYAKSSLTSDPLVQNNVSLNDFVFELNDWVPETNQNGCPLEIENVTNAEEIFFLIKQRKPRLILPKCEKSSNHRSSERLYYESLLAGKVKSRAEKGPDVADMEKALKCIEDMRNRTSSIRDNSNECKMCARKFSNRFNLLVHYRSHAGVKPFVCRICMTAFTRRHSLKHHMMCHSEEVHYVCPFCSRGFRSTTYFRDHVLKHKNVSAATCYVCHKDFANVYSLKRHINSRHEPQRAKGVKSFLGVSEENPLDQAPVTSLSTQVSKLFASPLSAPSFGVKIGLPRILRKESASAGPQPPKCRLSFNHLIGP